VTDRETFVAGAWQGLARPGFAASLQAALLSPMAGETFAVDGGRGALRLFPVEIPESHRAALPMGDVSTPAQMVLRNYLRGGVVRHFWREGFLMANRPLAEFEVHWRLEQAGLPVAPVLGVAWQRRGPLYYGVFATLRLAAQPLHGLLTGAEGDGMALCREIGALVRRMHDAGVSHPDLNVHNVIVGKAGPYLLDFDKAVDNGPPGQVRRASELLRFRRSLEKNGHGLGYFAELTAGYGALTIPGWLDRIYEARGRYRK